MSSSQTNKQKIRKQENEEEKIRESTKNEKPANRDMKLKNPHK